MIFMSSRKSSILLFTLASLALSSYQISPKKAVKKPDGNHSVRPGGIVGTGLSGCAASLPCRVWQGCRPCPYMNHSGATPPTRPDAHRLPLAGAGPGAAPRLPPVSLEVVQPRPSVPPSSRHIPRTRSRLRHDNSSRRHGSGQGFPRRTPLTPRQWPDGKLATL